MNFGTVKRGSFMMVVALAFGSVLAACGTQNVPPTVNLRTPEPVVVSFEGTIEVPAALLVVVDELEAPDVVSILVTRAYEQVGVATPDAAAAAATATALADPMSDLNSQLTPEPVSGGGLITTGGGVTSSLLVTPTAHAPAPALVVQSGSVRIPNGVNRAVCTIQGVGDCTPSFAAGQNVAVSFLFGVEGSQSFRWGSAQILFTRDGGGYRSVLVGNGRDPNPPNTSEGQQWVLPVGGVAEFRAGIENLPEGYYTARLLICQSAVSECEQGRGWAEVGGETVQFLVVQR